MALFQPLTSGTPAPTTGTAGFLATNWLAPTTGTTQVGPPKPTIIATAKPATTQLNNITTQAKNIDSSMAAQSQRIAQDKAASDAAAAQAKAVTDAAAAKKTTEDANAKAIADATAALEKYNLPTGAKLGDNGTVLDANGNSIGDASKYLKPTDGSISADLGLVSRQMEDAYNKFSETQKQFQNGAIPLTPEQQSQLENLRAQFDQLKAEQRQYNANYEGGTNIAGIVSGRQRYAPEIQLGIIQKTVSDGLQKVQAIEMKAVEALSNMKAGFQSSNYKQVQEAYNQYNDFLKEKSALIRQTQQDVAQKIKDERDATYRETQIANEMSKPAREADARVQNYIIDMAMKYPDAFANLSDEELSNINLSNAAKLVSSSPSYRASIAPKASGGGPGGPVDFESPLYSGLSSATSTAVRSKVTKFGSEPIITNFNVITEGYNFAKKLSSTTKNPSDDQALIYSFAKVMDPNSVVREGEYNTVQKYSQSLKDAYGKSVSQAINGTGFLTETARNNIKKTIEARYNASKASYDNLFNQYTSSINSLTGRDDGSKFLVDYSAGSNTGSTASVSEADIAETVRDEYKNYNSSNREDLIKKLVQYGADKDVAARYVYQYIK